MHGFERVCVGGGGGGLKPHPSRPVPQPLLYYNHMACHPRIYQPVKKLYRKTQIWAARYAMPISFQWRRAAIK